MTGLLDGINNPEFLAAIEHQRAIVQRVADHIGCNFDDALAVMMEDDRAAMEMFHVGNTIDRKTLH